MTAAEAWEVKTRLPNLGGRGEVARLRLPSETSGAGLLGVSGECDMKLFPLENITGGLGRRSHFRSPCLHPVLSPPLPGGRPPAPQGLLVPRPCHHRARDPVGDSPKLCSDDGPRMQTC